MKSRFPILVLSLSLLLLPTAVWAGNWYFGGGLESVSIEVEGTDIIDDGTGFTLSFGYRFTPGLALDFLWGGSSHEDILGGDVAYGRFALGGKFILTSSDQFMPYLTVGLMGHALAFDLFEDIDGSGLYFGGGADFFINPRNSIGLGIRASSWTGEDPYFEYDMDTSIVSIVYNYHFVD